MTQTFEEWMKEVDKAVQDRTGCSVHDLADCSFADWYDEGVKPASAAARAIRNSKEG